MNFIKSFIYCFKSGWHSGRGHRFIRKRNYQKALEHYLIAYKYEERKDLDPIGLECIARTLARLDRYDEALNYAEKSYSQLKSYEKPAPLIEQSIERVQYLIVKLKSRDIDAIKELLLT